jgi:transcriptional regulator with XRE-family HTH domain
MATTQKLASHSKGVRRASGKAQEQFLRRLGLKILKDLSDRGMTVDGLALQVGVARSTLREITAGRSNPRLLTLVEIAHGLGYSSVSVFFEGL